MKRILAVAALAGAIIAVATGCPCRGENCVVPPSVQTITIPPPAP